MSDYEISCLNKDISLRALLFAMVFYILASPITNIYISKMIPMRVESQIIGSLIFAVIFYIISVNI
jgi:hypothetical protein